MRRSDTTSTPIFRTNLRAGSSFIYPSKRTNAWFSLLRGCHSNTSRLLSQTFYTVSIVLERIWDSHLIAFLASNPTCVCQGFISKLVPQPQLLVAAGFPTILNWLPINSIVKSTLLPLSSSRLGSSMTTFAPKQSLDSKSVSSSGEIAEVLVRDMRYWKPWHPPDSTVTRKARSGLDSLVIISLRR